MSYIWIISCFLGIIISEASSSPIICDKRKADHCFAEVASFRILPPSAEELKEMCHTFNESTLCVSNYMKNCLDPFTREIVRFTLKRIDHVLHERCDMDHLKVVAEKHSHCISKSNEDLDKCLDMILIKLDQTEKFHIQKRIPAACCLWSEFQHCISLAVRREGCTEETEAFVLEVSRSASEDVVDLLCYEHESHKSDKCRALKIPEPPPGTKPAYESIFFTLETLAQSFIGF